MDANSLFDAFVAATNFTKIQQLFSQLCALLNIDPYDNFNVFKKLKAQLNDWRAQKLWSLLVKRAEQKEYCNQKACRRLSVLVIGAGPCGLRSAIECALLGAYVVLVEQRDCFSRNNVLHIWPFVIQDLKNFGIKIFYPKFCRGSIDHISIRQLQIFLVKIALVLGVQIHDSVAFQRLIFPQPDQYGKVSGWRAEFDPPGHILSEFVFDALIGADGKRNTVPGFPKREMRGKLAIGITANFVNQRTLAEEKVQEISGVAYIFNQQFFKDMKKATGVDLENIVYYKDETHYFVMCAKKQSLLDKGVIVEDNDDVSVLLSPSNVNQEKLCDYAATAADFATGGKLPYLKYAVNHNGNEDVAMFDFTSLFSAQCSVRLVERHDRRLLMAIVGDSLHEPFWPTGSGCARGFLGVFDTVWMLRSYGLNKQGLVILLAERESVYRLLAQAKSDNLQKQIHKYTIDPKTRYISLEMTVQPHEISHLIDTDNPRNVETNQALPLRVSETDDCVSQTYLKSYKLWRFCHQALFAYHLHIVNFGDSWDNGRALAALLGKFRPDLIDYLSLCIADDPSSFIEQVFTIVKETYGIEPPCTNHTEWLNTDVDSRIAYISGIVEALEKDAHRMRETLMNAIRISTMSHKRKATRQVDVSRAKKTEPIRRRATDLLSAFSSTTFWTENENLLTKKSTEKNQHEFHTEQVFANDESMTAKSSDDNVTDHSKLCKRLDTNFFARLPESESKKHWTRRPAVDKLNPERLYAVEKIISGELEKEKTQEIYRSKYRLANLLTKKMDKFDIDEMKLKLEQTAMGLLFNKEQYRVLTSKEEKIVCTNAAAARQTVKEGFRHHDDGKFKEIDEKLSKAETLLKNQNLAGVDIVSRTKKKSGVVAPGGKKPPLPVPPKKVSSQMKKTNSVAYYSDNQNISQNKSSPNWSRPYSIAVDQLTYDSVNARRQMICQLCFTAVYLAERIQVEGMFIHKKCFRCAFCEQPLRLGNCSQDRNLQNYNPRFFCMQHINLPVSEKITRIEKNGIRKLTDSSAATNLSTVNAIIGSVVPRPNQPTAPAALERTGRNSPAVLLGKTMEKMRVQKEALGTLTSSTLKCQTPERAEFGSYGSKKIIKEESSSMNKNEVSSNCSQELNKPTEDELSDGSEYSWSDKDDDDESDFMEDELIDLESVLMENFDQKADVGLTEAQASKLLKAFKKRRQEKLERQNNSLSEKEFKISTKPSKKEIFENKGIRSAVTDAESSDLKTKEEKNKSHRSSEAKTENEIKLCGVNDRRSISSKGVSRHLSLDLSESNTNRMHRMFSVDETPNSTHLSSPTFTAQQIAEFHSQQNISSNRGLLATIFSPERVMSLRSVNRQHRAFSRTVSEERNEEKDVVQHRTESGENQEDFCSRFKCSNFGKLQTPKDDCVLEQVCINARKDGFVSEQIDDINIRERKTISHDARMLLSKQLSNSSVMRPSTSFQTTSPMCLATNSADEVSLEQKSERTSLTEKEIRRVQKLAERIVKQKEQERINAAQDMQRELEEIDVRKSEVKVVASDLERRLCDDAENQWILEQWLLYVQEMAQLKQREEELRLRVYEFEVNQEYKCLQMQLKEVQDVDVLGRSADEIQTEKMVLKKILEVLERRDTIQKQLKQVKKRALELQDSEPSIAIRLRGASYHNFEPVFI